MFKTYGPAPTEKRPITLEDVFALVDDVYKKLEIVNGDWHMLNNLENRFHGAYSGAILSNILFSLSDHVSKHKLGRVYTGTVSFILGGDRNNIQLMRYADTSFMRTEHLATKDMQDEPYYRAPALAVEMLHNDVATDLFQRVRDFLAHGTSQVWIVQPFIHTITVCFQDKTARSYEVGEVIDGGDLLPGFSLDVAKVFERRART